MEDGTIKKAEEASSLGSTPTKRGQMAWYTLRAHALDRPSAYAQAMCTLSSLFKGLGTRLGRRLLPKQAVKKEPVTIKDLQQIVSHCNMADLGDVHTVTLWLMCFAAFLRYVQKWPFTLFR